MFNPLRRRVQAFVDHRFNRSKYDAERVMAGFTGSLRDEVDPGTVGHGRVSVVSETMHPASAGVWVRGSDMSARSRTVAWLMWVLGCGRSF